jgi:hypothetical protein
MDRPSSRRFRLLAAVAAAATLALPAAASAAPPGGWADADSATIHPGVQTVTAGGQCTANFVFESGGDVYLGQAAHCAGTGGATETDGCDSGSRPLGTPVEIQGASRPGTLAYSSWLTMQARGETNSDACAYNDFALVRIDPADHDKVNPSIPVFGGPHGIDRDGTTVGEQVYTYGNSSLRLGLTQLSPHVGTSLGTSGNGWTHSIYTVTPGVPGDSGSAVVDADGTGLGILVTLQIAPLAGANGVTDLGRALDYANAYGGLGSLSLADGTEPFSGSVLSLVGGLLG